MAARNSPGREDEIGEVQRGEDGVFGRVELERDSGFGGRWGGIRMGIGMRRGRRRWGTNFFCGGGGGTE